MDMSSPAPSPNGQVTVRRGDTLIGLVKAHYKGQGVALDDGRMGETIRLKSRDTGRIVSAVVTGQNTAQGL